MNQYRKCGSTWSGDQDVDDPIHMRCECRRQLWHTGPHRCAECQRRWFRPKE